MMNATRKKKRKSKDWLEVPHGQLKALADEYRVSTVTMRRYLRRDFGPYSTARGMQEMVRAEVVKRYK